MVKLSVIIPVYNTEKFLPECIESIYSQNMEDFEVICVDDGSTDNSPNILRDYQKRELNLIVISKNNEGSGIARNLGLENSRGKYILFADSDDFYPADAFKTIFSKIEKSEAEILIFGALTLDKNRLRKGHYSAEKIPKRFRNKIFSGNDLKKDLFKIPSPAWSKLYNREFLIKNDIQFQNVRAGQDQIFFLKSMLCASKIAVLNENLYCYRKNRAGSVTSIKKKQDYSPLYIYYAAEELVQNLKEDYRFFILDKYFIKAVTRLAKMDFAYKSGYYAELQKLLNRVGKTFPDSWREYFHPLENDSYLLLKLKIIFSLLKFLFVRKILKRSCP